MHAGVPTTFRSMGCRSKRLTSTFMSLEQGNPTVCILHLGVVNTNSAAGCTYSIQTNDNCHVAAIHLLTRLHRVQESLGGGVTFVGLAEVSLNIGAGFCVEFGIAYFFAKDSCSS